MLTVFFENWIKYQWILNVNITAGILVLSILERSSMLFEWIKYCSTNNYHCKKLIGLNSVHFLEILIHFMMEFLLNQHRADIGY